MELFSDELVAAECDAMPGSGGASNVLALARLILRFLPARPLASAPRSPEVDIDAFACRLHKPGGLGPDYRRASALARLFRRLYQRAQASIAKRTSVRCAATLLQRFFRRSLESIRFKNALDLASATRDRVAVQAYHHVLLERSRASAGLDSTSPSSSSLGGQALPRPASSTSPSASSPDDEAHPGGPSSGGNAGRPPAQPALPEALVEICPLCSLPLAQSDVIEQLGVLVHLVCAMEALHLDREDRPPPPTAPCPIPPETADEAWLGLWLTLPDAPPTGESPAVGLVVAVAVRGSSAGREGQRFLLLQPPGASSRLVSTPVVEGQRPPAVPLLGPSGTGRLFAPLSIPSPRSAGDSPRLPGVWPHSGPGQLRFMDAVTSIGGVDFWFGSHLVAHSEAEARAAAGAEYGRFLALRRLARGCESSALSQPGPPSLAPLRRARSLSRRPSSSPAPCCSTFGPSTPDTPVPLRRRHSMPPPGAGPDSNVPTCDASPLFRSPLVGSCRPPASQAGGARPRDIPPPSPRAFETFRERCAARSSLTGSGVGVTLVVAAQAPRNAAEDTVYGIGWVALADGCVPLACGSCAASCSWGSSVFLCGVNESLLGLQQFCSQNHLPASMLAVTVRFGRALPPRATLPRSDPLRAPWNDAATLSLYSALYGVWGNFRGLVLLHSSPQDLFPEVASQHLCDSVQRLAGAAANAAADDRRFNRVGQAVAGDVLPGALSLARICSCASISPGAPLPFTPGLSSTATGSFVGVSQQNFRQLTSAGPTEAVILEFIRASTELWPAAATALAPLRLGSAEALAAAAARLGFTFGCMVGDLVQVLIPFSSAAVIPGLAGGSFTSRQVLACLRQVLPSLPAEESFVHLHRAQGEGGPVGPSLLDASLVATVLGIPVRVYTSFPGGLELSFEASPQPENLRRLHPAAHCAALLIRRAARPLSRDEDAYSVLVRPHLGCSVIALECTSLAAPSPSPAPLPTALAQAPSRPAELQVQLQAQPDAAAGAAGATRGSPPSLNARVSAVSLECPICINVRPLRTHAVAVGSARCNTAVCAACADAASRLALAQHFEQVGELTESLA